MWKGPRHPERKCPVANLSSWADLPSLIKSEKRNPLRIKDINDIKNPKPCSQCLYILQCHCSSAHLLHGCDPLDGRWIRESLPVARPYRTAQSHPSTLEVAWMLPTACKPAIASLRDSWKRKEKEGKTSETNLVSNGTTTNTKTGHTHTHKKKRKTVAVLAVQGFNFLQHACTRFHKSICDSRRKPSQLGPLMVSIFQQNITQRYLVVQWSRRDPKIRIHLLAEVQLDPQSLWGCLGCRWIPSLC